MKDLIKNITKRLDRLIELSLDKFDGGASEKAYKICKDIIEEEAKKYNNGWIPCSERLPEDDRKQYIVQKTNGFIDIVGFTKDAYKLSRYDFIEYKGEKKQLFYNYDSEYGYIEWECEAWQPLPEPYQPKDCSTCANNTDFDEVDNGCYMCCKGLENNYQPKGE